VIHITCPPGRDRLRAWVCDVILRDWLGQDFRLDLDAAVDDWIVRLDGAAGELRLPDILLSFPEAHWLGPDSLPPLPLLHWSLEQGLQKRGLPRELPLLYCRPLPGDALLQVTEGGTGQEVRLGLDLFGSTLFLLGCYEEYAIQERDNYARFSSGSSFLRRAGVLDRPLANEYALLLWRLLSQLWPGLSRPSRTFRVSPTHDVDKPLGIHGVGFRGHLRSTVGDLVVRRDPKLAWRRLGAIQPVLQGNLDADVNNNFGWIMQQSEQRGLQSTFYFLVDDSRYCIEHPWIAGLLQGIHARGHRIGVHPTLGTSTNFAALSACVQRFRRVLRAAGLTQLADGPLAARQHYLQWQAPETWRNYHAAGLASDSSCSFAQRAGFRCGSCWAFEPCDLRSAETVPLREQPLIAMETSMLLPAPYEGLSLAGSVQRTLMLGEACRRVDGDFVILWHNSSLLGSNEQAAYCAVLDGLTGISPMGPSLSP
jgi:hypothetical protein